MITLSPRRRRAPRPRRRAAALAFITVGIGAVLTPASGATAAEGPAPAPKEHRIIAGVHTDAVSTFLDGGNLTLGSKADVAEGNGTRFAAEDIRFHLADDAKATVPAGYEFIAPAGSQVWIAPESNPGTGRLWPGFSTEAVPAGAVADDRTTLTLTGLEGPGRLELFTAAGFGGAKRLWSSDDDGVKAFTIGRTHMHANWAFTASGIYRIGVRATATVAGQQQTAQATYTFVVGALPEATGTSTTLTTSATTLVAGEKVTLGATVAPPEDAGWVEFLDGTTVLGHAPLSGGRASLDVSTLPLGNRSVSARFVPHLLNAYARSASEPVTVTVTEQPGGDVFAMTGLADRYRAGERIDLGVTGATLGEGQQWWWLIRLKDQPTEYLAARGDKYTREATAALDGADIRVQIVDAKNKPVQQTGYRRLTIDGSNPGSGEPVTVTGFRDSYYTGDPVRVTVDHRALVTGESGRWVTRPLFSTDEWEEVTEWSRPVTVPGSPNTFLIDTSWLNSFEWAYEILAADGTVAGRSPAATATISFRELLLSGIRTVYRAGDTLEAKSELYPPRGDVAYEWGIVDDGGFNAIPGAVTGSLELPVTADLDGKTLYLTVNDATTGNYVAGAQQQLRVTDAAPGDQLLFLDSLSGHYHQGNTIRLKASADPVASDTDTYRWLWKRPDQAGFVVIGQATAATHELRAEQALDGTQVKAELRSASGDVLATSEPATIHVDDHGAAPQQKVSVEGAADAYGVGDEIRLTASVAPASVLSRWEWHLRKPGETTSQVVAGQNDAQLSLTAAAEHDGAAVVARLTFDDGRPYVEAAPVVLRVGGTSPPGDASKSVTATISGTDGALVISVDAEDRAVTLPAAELSADGDRWESTGALRPVTVTDTRPGRPGWSVSGQLPDGFRTAGGQSFGGDHLGWSPSAAGPGVVAGPVSAGLGGSAVLATAPDGAGLGTARLDAELRLSVPTDTAPGTYTGTLTLTAI